MLVRQEQPEKASLQIFVSPSDITKEVNFLGGNFCAINVGPSALVRLEQPEKTPSPISVTDEGMEILDKFLQQEKALQPIFSTDIGMIVFSHPVISVLLSVWITALQFSRES